MALMPPPPPPPPHHGFACSDAQGLKHASPSYMSKQTDINAKMRAILIDWLVEVHLKFKLMPETLYLTINLIDRYLEKETIMRNKLQLVGVTAMFIASKYEEIYAPVRWPLSPQTMDPLPLRTLRNCLPHLARPRGGVHRLLAH